VTDANQEQTVATLRELLLRRVEHVTACAPNKMAEALAIASRTGAMEASAILDECDGAEVVALFAKAADRLAASIIRAHSLDANGASTIRRACFLVAGGIIRALIAARPGLAPVKGIRAEAGAGRRRVS
jgi:hypothetical protein